MQKEQSCFIDSSPAPALDRGLAILELLAESEQGLSFSQLANKLGLNATTLTRLLKVLQMREYVRKEATTGYYRIAAKITLFAHQTPVNRVLLNEGHEAIAALSAELGVTTLIIRFLSDRMVCLDKVTHPDNLAMLAVGAITYEFTQTPWGWLHLAHYGDVEMQGRLKYGYADDHAQINPEIRRWAAPIYDGIGRLVAALVAGSMATLDIKEERALKIGTALKQAAEGISRALGYKRKEGKASE